MTTNQAIYEHLISFINRNNIIVEENLKNHTYTKLGGKADFFLTPSTYEEVQKVVKYAKKENIPLTIIGNGSNLIVRDGGIRGIVISVEKFNYISIKDTSIVAQSGASIINVSRQALEANLSGLEFACGIPGSVGGTIYMNAGAYGGEIKDVLEHCIVIDQSGNIVKREFSDLTFSYRHSSFSENNDIILEAKFLLKKGDYEDIIGLMTDFTNRRNNNQPLEYPSCGSVFKRPLGHFAGKLIQESNLQGARIGGAEVSKKHAGFIINIDNATSAEYINLIEHVQNTVKQKFNVYLEREVKIIGEE